MLKGTSCNADATPREPVKSVESRVVPFAPLAFVLDMSQCVPHFIPAHELILYPRSSSSVCPLIRISLIPSTSK